MFDFMGIQLEGMGTELGGLAIIYIIIREVIAPLIKRIPTVQQWMAKRNQAIQKPEPTPTSNPDSIPGGSATCIEHGKKLTKICTQIEFMQKHIGELKDDMKELKRRK